MRSFDTLAANCGYGSRNSSPFHDTYHNKTKGKDKIASKSQSFRKNTELEINFSPIYCKMCLYAGYSNFSSPSPKPTRSLKNVTPNYLLSNNFLVLDTALAI